VIGNNIYVGDGCTLEDSLLCSSDFYTNDASRAASRAKGEAVLGVGARSQAVWGSSDLPELSRQFRARWLQPRAVQPFPAAMSAYPAPFNGSCARGGRARPGGQSREDGRMGSTKQHARPRGLRTCKQGSSFAAARQRAGVLQ